MPLILSIFFTLSSGLWAQSPYPNNNEEDIQNNELIYEVLLANGYRAQESLLLLQDAAGLLLPIGELSQALGIPLTFFPEQGKVKGRFRPEEDEFVLDIKNCIFIKGSFAQQGSISNNKCSLGIFYLDDIFISSEKIEEWMNIEIRHFPLKSRVVLESQTPLPIENKLEEDIHRKYILAKSAGRKKDQTKKTQQDATQLTWGGPYADLNAYYQVNSQKQTQAQHRLGLGAATGVEWHGWENNFRFNYDQGEEKGFNSRYTLSRNSEETQHFVFIPYRQFQAFDIYSPSFAGARNSRLAQGFYISNQPLSYSSQVASREIRGLTEPNWTVELYQSGVLSAASRSNELGEYVFENIPVFYGNNNFKVVSIGPQGQRREETRSYSISNNQPQQGQFYYALSAAQSHLSNDVILDTNYGLGNNWNVGSRALWSQNLIDPSQTQIYFGNRVGAYFESLSPTLDFVNDNKGAHYINPRIALPWTQGSFDLNYYKFSEFESEIFQKYRSSFLDERYELSGLFSLPIHHPVTLRFISSLNRYESLDLSYNENKLFLLTGILGTQVQLGAEHLKGDTSYWTLNEQIQKSFSRSIVKLKLEHDTNGLNSIENEITLRSASRKFHTRFLLAHNFRSEENTAIVAVSRDFEKLRWGFDVSASDLGKLSAMTTLSTSLFADTYHSQLRSTSRNLSEKANAIIEVCMDTNYNEKCDEHEAKASSIAFQINNRSESLYSDEEGILFLAGLAPYSSYQLALDGNKLFEERLKAPQSSYQIYTESGRSYQLSIPLRYSLEMDGLLEIIDRNGKLSPAKNRILELVHIESQKKFEARSEFDGYFLFEDLVPGEYEIRLAGDIERIDNPPSKVTLSPSDENVSLELKIKK